MPNLTRERLRRLTGSSVASSDATLRLAKEPYPSRDGVLCFSFAIVGQRASIPCLLVQPPPNLPIRGAVIYAHAHGNRPDIGKQELVMGRPALLDPPLGVWLALQGFVVISPDLPGFGERQQEGSESSLAKAAQWQGGSLLGAMLDDMQLVLNWLQSDPLYIHLPKLVAGFSMGATLASFLGAIRSDICAVIQICSFANLMPLLKTGAHDLHGHYMTVPGLLPHYDLSDVACLVSPRPHFVAVGLQDPITPEFAARPAFEKLADQYIQVGAEAALSQHIDIEAGHSETIKLRLALKSFLARHF